MANEALEQKHADDLSIGRYTFKKIREMVVMGGGAIGGALAGIFAGKPSEIPLIAAEVVEEIPLLKRLPTFISGMSKGQAALAGIGAMIGTVAGALIIGYEHWRKEESQKLAVDEMNKDMADTIAIQPVDKELVTENKRLRGMLHELEEKRSYREEILAKGPKSHTDHAAHESGGHSWAS